MDPRAQGVGLTIRLARVPSCARAHWSWREGLCFGASSMVANATIRLLQLRRRAQDLDARVGTHDDLVRPVCRQMPELGYEAGGGR